MMRKSVDEFTQIGVTISSQMIINLRYANDIYIVLIATSPEAIHTLLDKLSAVLVRELVREQHKENQSTGGFNQGNCGPSYM